jgi:hypothetical protein
MTVATSNSNKPSPFDKIPNEILVQILSCIIYDHTIYGYKRNGSPQLLALLHVSRRFRIFLLQHVWLDRHFDFSEFLDIDPWATSPSRTSILTTNFCNALFSDPLLRETLKRKTDWYFPSLEVVLAVLAYVPSFTQSAHTVILEFHDVDAALYRLGDCKGMTRLDVTVASYGSTLDLDWISIFVNVLKLKIFNFNLPEMYHGHLGNLEGLEEYSVAQEGPYNFDAPGVLPMASADTLTRMTLENCRFRPDVDFKAFTSLKHLTTKGHPDDCHLRNLIADLPADLYSLDTFVDIEELRVEIVYGIVEVYRKTYNLFDCSCLKNLKEIRLGMFFDGDEEKITFPGFYVAACMEVVEKMVGKLEWLEKVELWGGLDLERVHVLSRLRNLKTLKWVVCKDRYIEGMGQTRDLSIGVSEILKNMGLEVEVTVEITLWELKTGDLLYE